VEEEAGMLYDTGQVIHIDTNKLAMGATILHPNIRISLALVESHAHDCICKEFMQHRVP
jgi:hypothetical protein